MPFSNQTVWEAWLRSKGRCECTHPAHGHPGKCNKPMRWEERGREDGWNAWEAHHSLGPSVGGDDDLDNCQILCWRCYRAATMDEDCQVRDASVFKRKLRLNFPRDRKGLDR